MPSKFGGVEVGQPTGSKFGGIPVSSKPVKKTRAQIEQEVAQAQMTRPPIEEMSTMESIGNAAFDPVLGLSLQPLAHGIGQAATGLMNLPARAWHAATGTPTEEWQLGRDEPVSRLPYQLGQATMTVPLAHNENVSPLPRVLAQTLESLTTPENLATLPFAAGETIPARMMATVMAPQMSVGAVQSGQQALNPELSPEQREEEAYRAIISGGLGTVLGRQIGNTRAPSPSGLQPGDIQSRLTSGDRDVMAGRVPPERQLGYSATQFPGPRERGLLLAENNPQVPTDVNPAGGARFVQDPMGRTLDFSQLTEKEAREAMRGPRVYVPREQKVRPAQESPVIIDTGKNKNLPDWAREQMIGQGLDPARMFNDVDLQNPTVRQAIETDPTLTPEQKRTLLKSGSTREVFEFNENPQIEQVSVPTKAPVEQGGGKVSFASEAGATEIPNARQSAQQQGKLYGGAFFLDPDFWKGPAKDTGKMVVGGIQRLKSAAETKLDATTPLGAGKIPGVARVLDPRSYKKTPEEQTLLAHGRTVDAGKKMTGVWLAGTERLKNPFPVDKQGRVTLEGGKLDYMEDVIRREMEKPGSQPLSKFQREWVRWAGNQIKQVGDMLKEEGIDQLEMDDGSIVKVGEGPYFPRPPVGHAKIKGQPSPVKKAIGAEQFFQKSREHVTEKQGVAMGVKYEPNPYGRIARYLDASYRAIADRRLAQDPAMKGLTGEQSAGTDYTYHPALRGRLFPTEVAQRINDYYNQLPNKYLRAAGRVNDELKSAKFSVDVSTPLNQGLALLGSHPIRWAKTTALSLKALGDGKTFSKYIGRPENLEGAQFLSKNNSNLANMYDFLQGSQTKTLASQVHPIKWSGRSMSTFLGVAKVEMYKALKPLAKKHGWSDAELAETIDNFTLSGRMEAIGVSPSRALTERLIFNAPSYMRAAANLATMIGEGVVNTAKGEPNKSASGRVGLQALRGLLTSTLVLAYATYKASVDEGKMSQEEMNERLDPRSSKFLKFTYDIKKGDGKLPVEDRLEVSYGNIFVAGARVLGDYADIATSDKELGPGPKNPGIKFLTNRRAPIVSTIEELASGKDYKGEDSPAWKALLKLVVPASLEPLTTKGGFENWLPTRQGMHESLLQGMGLNVHPEGYGSKYNRAQDKAAKQLYGVGDYKDLNVGQRLNANRLVEDSVEKPEMSRQQKLMALETVEERGKKLESRLSPMIQEKLEDNGLRVSGYSSSSSISKMPLRLEGDEEREKLASLMVSEAERRLNNMFKIPKFDSLPQKEKQRIFESVMEASRSVAWAFMQKEINDRSKERKPSQRQ